MHDIASAAARWGVETGYFDARGQWRQPPSDSLGLVVRALATIEPCAPPQVVRDDGDAGAQARNPDEPLRVPRRAFQPSALGEKGGWLLAVQLYGVRSARNWGIGDFTDLADLVQLAADSGAAGIAVNPLHNLLSGQTSPYSPSSRLFLNSLMVDVERVPGFPGLAALSLADETARLRATEMVDYQGVAAVKTKALAAAHARFRKSRSAAKKDFDAFRREHGASLAKFAAFEVLWERFRAPWWEWPAEYRVPTPGMLDELRRSAPERLEFHEFVQWQADRQLAACGKLARDLALPIGLYLDIAVGVSPDGADAWSEQHTLLRNLTIGAPPDVYNPAGQCWGLASFHPSALMCSDFSLLRETLRASMRHAGAVRLDHVLGLNRMFVVPDGCDASHGTYVRFPLEAMTAVVAQESVVARCLVIGEDLGTVPDGFREKMADWGLWSYRVTLFERRHDGSFQPPHAYPAQALVTFNTHDLPTFKGWLTAHDIAEKHAIGVDPGETTDERADTRRRLQEALHAAGLGSLDSFIEVVRFMARTPSRLLVISAEDVLGVTEQPNMPGTIDEHPNWRRKLPRDLDAIAAEDALRVIADVLASEGRAAAGEELSAG